MPDDSEADISSAARVAKTIGKQGGTDSFTHKPIPPRLVRAARYRLGFDFARA